MHMSLHLSLPVVVAAINDKPIWAAEQTKPHQADQASGLGAMAQNALDVGPNQVAFAPSWGVATAWD